MLITLLYFFQELFKLRQFYRLLLINWANNFTLQIDTSNDSYCYKTLLLLITINRLVSSLPSLSKRLITSENSFIDKYNISDLILSYCNQLRKYIHHRLRLSFQLLLFQLDFNACLTMLHTIQSIKLAQYVFSLILLRKNLSCICQSLNHGHHSLFLK